MATVGRTRPWARVVAAVVLGLTGLVLGLLGTMLVSLWALNAHDFMGANENILQCPPWLVALPCFALGIARARPKTSRWAWRLTASAAGAAVLGVLLKALPWFRQDNWQIIAATLPLLVGMVISVRWLRPISASE